ncbi:MAG: ABC transporter ATP-binding protein [Paludibacteraceae bacterium]|nr:ABC transporter ATP-binding protein [Paludibacteraceae bacterium]
MMATAIEFEHVGKQYRLGLVSTKTLSHDIRRFWITNVLGKEDPYLKIGETNDRASKGNSEYVWALRDIDFKVEQGDVVGIIGKNGAGKSTLLKLLSRVTGPTTGTIRAHGRIGSLLEVGTGFHNEMTGRENIFMNGAILGMTRAEIQRKLDEIIDFSGCERYIDTPVKRYSSGMTVRLGFAVAAFLEPEILVVDEVLAVGDAEFQKKAIGKMKDVSQGQGRTVLFVSHNMASIRNLCTSGVVLEYGQVKFRGDNINQVVDFYLNGNSAEVGDRAKLSGGELKSYRVKDCSSRQLEITEVERLTPYKVDSTDEQTYRVRVCRRDQSIKKVCLNTLVDDILTDNRVGLTCSDIFDIPEGKNEFEIEVTLRHLNLTKGNYKMNFWLSSDPVINSWNILDGIYNSLTFEVVSYNQKPITVWPNDCGFNYFDGCTTKIA